MTKYSVGFVCGFFDIIHKGHIDMLKIAKSYCDYLIVGVGTDDFMLVRKKRCSVLDYEQRKSIVEAIKYVDLVVPETNLDKVEAFNKYHFDVMFAGDDHLNEPIYIEATKQLKQLGVETVYIPRTFQMSSTILRERVYNIEKELRLKKRE